MLLFFGTMAFMPTSEKENDDMYLRGMLLKLKTTDHTQSPAKTDDMEILAGDKYIMMEILATKRNGKGKMMFNGYKGKNGEIILTDDDRKEYYLMNDAFVERMKKSLNQSKAMMDQALKGLTKEQREMIEKAQRKSGNKMPGLSDMMKTQSKPILNNTGKRATKNGYPCVKYDVLKDGVKIRELWVTDWSNVEGGGEINSAFKSMNDFINQIKDMFDGMPGASGPYEEMNMKNGFPVVTRNFNEYDGSLEDETVLESITERDLDPDAFEPPKGYRLRTMGPQ